MKIADVRDLIRNTEQARGYRVLFTPPAGLLTAVGISSEYVSEVHASPDEDAGEPAITKLRDARHLARKLRTIGCEEVSVIWDDNYQEVNGWDAP